MSQRLQLGSSVRGSQRHRALGHLINLTISDTLILTTGLMGTRDAKFSLPFGKLHSLVDNITRADELDEMS